jgi:hypothetical protein
MHTLETLHALEIGGRTGRSLRAAQRPRQIRLTQLDGELPNLALMKLAAWHREHGDAIHFTRNPQRGLFEPDYDIVYGSAIFTFSRPQVERLRREFPNAIVGGTGAEDWRAGSYPTVEQHLGVASYEHYDYSLYPNFTASIGFASRGCRLRCGFCVVPLKEGKPKSTNTIADIWRGDPYPKHLHLLDNDFFGNIIAPEMMAELEQSSSTLEELSRKMRALEKQLIAAGEAEWQKRLEEIRVGRFRTCFNQGINVRMIDAEIAKALASVKYYDKAFKKRRLYTAWDNLRDESIFMRGVNHLFDAGIKAHHLMVYMLVGYDAEETWERLFYRFDRMVKLGMKPYPMVYEKAPRHSGNAMAWKDLKAFQRWVNGGYYRFIPWSQYHVSNRDRLADHRRAIELGFSPAA